MSTVPNRLEHRLERRGAQRFEVHLPLSIHFDGRTVPGFTQDLSGRGIFFYAETPLPQGAVVELTFTMPSEITLTENVPVRCRGRVLRSSASQARHSQDSQRSGIAVQLDSYEYLPAGEPVAQFVRVSSASAAAGPAPRWGLLQSFQSPAFALQSKKPAVWRVASTD
jgi:PilZ domain